jgi:hypothetical protein
MQQERNRLDHIMSMDFTRPVTAHEPSSSLLSGHTRGVHQDREAEAPDEPILVGSGFAWKSQPVGTKRDM